ncbi:DNA repair exonuclease [Virgibacillus sp. MSJ-26]|uniref:metallophosphoesterase family protein n=1 Tax=Virgibacillus sp. MSJ-26 TaxID=2841522 RepID=UPI001C11DA47|nr:DNA repair exonuclease [Virgibacillus sp. MSJ-26]MBU5465598.1 DNA repair exonuclease [Virgibacillus sp. MSJ-26]
MNKNLTFIHAADLHLDSPFKGLANIPERIFSDVLKSTFVALDNLITVAVERDVDFILLAGDLFDNERKSLKAQIHLRNAFERLKHHNINVYLSYGNHDFINGNAHQIKYPDNVYCFPDENVSHVVYKKNDHPMAKIYGFSYENQAIKINKTPEFKLADETIPFHIAMLHGSLASNTDHDTYAPFQLSELTSKGFDYWALGHIHQRDILSQSPPVVYPGNTQGRHRKESGAKGCYYVKLSETNVDLSFIPLQSILFNTVKVAIFDNQDINQFELILKTEMEKQLTNSPQLIYLIIENKNEEDFSFSNDAGLLDDLIEVVNDLFKDQKNWLYIYRYTVLNKRQKTSQDSFEHDYFIGELATQLTHSSIDDYLNDLYQHRQARKYLNNLSLESKEDIRNEAYVLLVNGLLDGQRE